MMYHVYDYYRSSVLVCMKHLIDITERLLHYYEKCHIVTERKHVILTNIALLGGNGKILLALDVKLGPGITVWSMSNITSVSQSNCIIIQIL